MTLQTEITQRRASGRTTCVTTPLGANASNAGIIIDSVVQKHGLRGLGDGWLEISAADAHAIVTALLHEDLAHQSEIMSLEQAAEFATQFFDLAPEPHAYFTNGDWSVTDDGASATLSSWDPISDAAFDSGVVCLGDGVAAVLWVEDEE